MRSDLPGVVLVHGHPVVRAGLKAALEGKARILGEAGDGRAGLDLVRALNPDVLFTGIELAGLNGVELTTRVAERCACRVIVFSRLPDEECCLRALREGASGFVQASASAGELTAALAQAMRGEIYLSPDLGKRLGKLFPMQMRSSSPVDRLTERQREILQLIAEGQTTKAIALILKISPKTVEYHRKQLMLNLKRFDIPALVRFAVRHRLVSGEA